MLTDAEPLGGLGHRITPLGKLRRALNSSLKLGRPSLRLDQSDLPSEKLSEPVNDFRDSICGALFLFVSAGAACGDRTEEAAVLDDRQAAGQ